MPILANQHNNPANKDSINIEKSTFYVKFDTLVSKTCNVTTATKICLKSRCCTSNATTASNPSAWPEEKACTQCVCRLTSVPWASLARTSVAIHTDHHPPAGPLHSNLRRCQNKCHCVAARVPRLLPPHPTDKSWPANMEIGFMLRTVYTSTCMRVCTHRQTDTHTQKKRARLVDWAVLSCGLQAELIKKQPETRP